MPAMSRKIAPFLAGTRPESGVLARDKRAAVGGGERGGDGRL